jgi:hypothetical protein
VGSYRLTAHTTAGVKPSDGWATGLGAVRQFNLTRNSQTTTLCFSRPVSSAAALTSSINPAGTYVHLCLLSAQFYCMLLR